MHFRCSLMQSSYKSARTCFSFTLSLTLGTVYTVIQSTSLINLSLRKAGSTPSSDRPQMLWKSSFVSQNFAKFSTLGYGGTSHLKYQIRNQKQSKIRICNQIFVNSNPNPKFQSQTLIRNSNQKFINKNPNQKFQSETCFRNFNQKP